MFVGLSMKCDLSLQTGGGAGGARYDAVGCVKGVGIPADHSKCLALIRKVYFSM